VDVTANAGFLCNKAAVSREIIKRKTLININKNGIQN
jgi:hypothetical protein